MEALIVNEKKGPTFKRGWIGVEKKSDKESGTTLWRPLVFDDDDELRANFSKKASRVRRKAVNYVICNDLNDQRLRQRCEFDAKAIRKRF